MELQIHHTCNQNGSAMFEVIRSMDMSPCPIPQSFLWKGILQNNSFLNCAGI